ncbi:MAG: hypothetical protein JWM20_942 [Patescibacteria group bacterium]|nr:hypothetical protein [Patescibacteria group bacterium]
MFDGAKPSSMSNKFTFYRQMALGYTLIVGLCIGLITPIAQAEAPTDTLYAASPTSTVVDGLTQEQRAAKIDAFFTLRDNSPLAGEGLTFVKAADTYGIDWKLLPAIATIESNGGKMLCSNPKGANNPFGFGSCKVPFKDFDEAIDTVAKNLGGYNPATEVHYKDKSVSEILEAYNPSSIRPDYQKLVGWAMKKIASTDASVLVATVSTSSQLAIK